MGQEDSDKLFAVFSTAKEKTFKKGEVIISEGEPYSENPCAYVIEKGGVSIFKKGSAGKSLPVGVATGGRGAFGVENLLGKLNGLTSYLMTYEAFEDTKVYSLTNEDLKQTLSKEGYTLALLNMTSYLSRWLRALLQRFCTVQEEGIRYGAFLFVAGPKTPKIGGERS
jgi:CRP-like cAMP-binding protein